MFKIISILLAVALIGVAFAQRIDLEFFDRDLGDVIIDQFRISSNESDVLERHVAEYLYESDNSTFTQIIVNADEHVSIKKYKISNI